MPFLFSGVLLRHLYRTSMSSLTKYIDGLNSEFLTLFTKKEDSFWESKMGLSSDPGKSQQQTSEAEIAVNHFMQDASKLAKLRDLATSVKPTVDESVAVGGWEKFFEAN